MARTLTLPTSTSRTHGRDLPKNRTGHGSPRLVELREDFSGSATPYQVDPEAGIIRRVKIVGRRSNNRPFHKLPSGQLDFEDVDGTDYSLEALEAAKPLYARAGVFINHPAPTEVGQDRDADKRFGWFPLESLQVDDQGLWGDLHFLKSHPMAPRVCEAATRCPELFALSHNSQGDGMIRDRRWVVTKIPTVRSVDLVCNGGTNRSLFESARPMTTRKLRDVLENAKSFDADKKRRVKELLENYGDMGDMSVQTQEGEEPDADSAMHEGFEAMVCQIFGDASLDDAEKMKRIRALLQAKAKVSGEAPEKVETKESESSDPEKKEDDKDQKEQTVKESAQLRAENTALRELIESGIASPPKSLVTALTRLDKQIDRRELIESFKGKGGASGGDKPRSKGVAKSDDAAELLESRGIPKDLKGQLAYLQN